MNQFNIIDIYMKTVYEKEKKLAEALDKLNNVEFENPDLLEQIRNLNEQKNTYTNHTRWNIFFNVRLIVCSSSTLRFVL